MFSSSVFSEKIFDLKLSPIFHKLNRGERLNREDGITLFRSKDLLGLGFLANFVREKKNKKNAFYIVNQHINYTNVCINGCAFCAFWRGIDSNDGFFFSVDEILSDIKKRLTLGIVEFHIVGACHPNISLTYCLDLLKGIKKIYPDATLKAFTPVEIDHIATLEGLSVKYVLLKLKEAGLRILPGGGAEIFDKTIRKEICPHKITGKRWLEICGYAHNMGIFTNATMLYGHIETIENRVDHLLQLRYQQDLTNGFNAFIPLPFHSKNTELNKVKHITALENLRVIAVSRLMLDNFVHIKAYWVMLGKKLAQIALSFGADDLDGTLVKENISHAAGAKTELGLTEKAFSIIIKNAGFNLIKRDSFYNQI